MTLNELKDGQKAIIVNLNAHKELKNSVGGKIKCNHRKIK